MIKAENLLLTQGIYQSLNRIDFVDTYCVTNHRNTLEEITLLIFGKEQVPKWIKKLLNLRNTLVRPLGLKTEIPDDTNAAVKVGDNIGFFHIYEIRENEIIMGMDDTHLNFRVSIFNSGEKNFNIKLTTLVQYNNSLGKAYFFFVKPFHKLVVKNMLKNAAE